MKHFLPSIIEKVASTTRPFRYAMRDKKSSKIRDSLTNTTVIGITGSCGKTSTTSFLSKILSDQGSTFTGIGQNNSSRMHKNLRAIKKPYRYLVQEIATYQKGVIRESTRVIRPDIGIITTVGSDHYTVFRSLEATAIEKAALVEELPVEGVAVLNADDPYVLAMASKTPAKVLTYGTSQGADIVATNIQANWPDLLSMNITYKNETIHLQTRLFGELLTTSLIAAIAGGIAAGVSLQQCVSSLTNAEAFDRRMTIHSTTNSVYFINDTKKSSYWSAFPAVSQIISANTPRKTVVFGSISDIGGKMSRKYRSIAKQTLEFSDRVIFVGEKSFLMAKLLTKPEYENKIFLFESIKDACRYLQSDLIKDELIYVKSSQNEHLERLIHFFGDTTCELKCFKQSCSEQINCTQCEESGLL